MTAGELLRTLTTVIQYREREGWGEKGGGGVLAARNPCGALLGYFVAVPGNASKTHLTLLAACQNTQRRKAAR